MLTPELLELPLSQESHVNSEILRRSDVTMAKPEPTRIRQHSTQAFRPGPCLCVIVVVRTGSGRGQRGVLQVAGSSACPSFCSRHSGSYCMQGKQRVWHWRTWPFSTIVCSRLSTKLSTLLATRQPSSHSRTKCTGSTTIMSVAR